MAALMAVTLTACGGQAGQAEPTPEVQPQETQEEVQQESEDTEPTEPASEETGLEACTLTFLAWYPQEKFPADPGCFCSGISGYSD